MDADQPSHERHRREGPASVACRVITVSDTRNEGDDVSGALIVRLLEETGHEQDAAALDAVIEGLPRHDAERTLDCLLAQSRRLERRFLLLIDNLDLVLDRLKEDHWALRETLQSQPEILLIGASARAVEASYQYDAAFYDFFKIDELKGLDGRDVARTGQCRGTAGGDG